MCKTLVHVFRTFFCVCIGRGKNLFQKSIDNFCYLPEQRRETTLQKTSFFPLPTYWGEGKFFFQLQYCSDSRNASFLNRTSRAKMVKENLKKNFGAKSLSNRSLHCDTFGKEISSEIS